MAHTDPTALTTHIRRMAATRAAAGGLPDAELVRRYAERHDEAAFEVLVWRHGPMVWATCRRVLRHHQDAEDAFQATFLTLARTARTGGVRRCVAGWLHRVAVNAALKSKARRRPGELTEDVPGPTEQADAELGGVVDEELEHLPAHYRAAFVLCCLEGMTSAEAAGELGCPVGTVDSRLHAARTRLRDRLARRGFGPGVLAAVGVAVTLPPAASAAAVALGTTAAAPLPRVDQLANELGGAMTVGTRTLTAAAAALGVVLVAAVVWAIDRPTPPREATIPIAAPVPRQADAGPTLLFTELVLKPGENSSHTLRLVKATFRDGKFADREGLYTADASEFGYQSRYRVVGGRYVVLQSATVVDVAEKKVVHSFDRGQVITVEGPLVYFYNIKDGGEQGVFRYDIGTGQRERVSDPGAGRWGLRGAVSPGGHKAIVRDFGNFAVPVGNEMPYDLALDRVGQKREPLGKFASTFGATGAGFHSGSDAAPGVWLDDDRFLTQTTLGKVVILNTAEKKQEKVVEIPPTHKPGEKSWETIGSMGFTPLGLQQPRFSLLPDGRVVYEADVVYFIDVAKKTWEKAAWLPLGHGFEYSAIPEIADVDRYSKRVSVPLRHKGKEIGTSESVWRTTREKPRVVVADGHLAVIERVQRPGKGVPTDAVRVWSAATGQWQTLDGWADAVIGWVK
jgi:RNA polymerase sigma factor (sigma-70 family)